MSINRIAIIGLGLIGGSFAKAIKHANPNIYISAFDKDEVLNQALSEQVIDTKLTDINESLTYDIIFLALPIENSLQIFKSLSPQLKEKQIISDLCSVKGIFIDVWKTLSSKGTYIGAHPMTGKEKSGYENSDALLFENSVFIVCSGNNQTNLVDDYLNLVRSTWARISLLDPYLHDKITARVSHLPQLLSVLLVNQASQKNNEVSFLDFAAGGFRDMTRIASSDFKIWESIIKYNQSEILKSIDIFQNQISSIKKLMSDEKYEEINNRESEVTKPNTFNDIKGVVQIHVKRFYFLETKN